MVNRSPALLPSQAGDVSRAAATARYLFFAPWPVQSGSGVNNVVVGLSEAMRDEYQPAIVVTGWKQPPPGQLWIKLPSPSFGLRSFAGFLLTLLPNLVRLRRITQGAIAVNPHYFGPEVFPLALLRRVRILPKLILSTHGADVSAIRASSWFDRNLYSWICRTADLVVACSHSLASEVKQISPQANVVAIWNGISSPPLQLGKRPIPEPYLVSIAAFVEKKGHDVLLRAFQQAIRTVPDLRLILIGGKGPELPAIEKTVEELGLRDRVELILDLPHEAVWNWLSHAECFVHAPREEPFGLAVLEAALVRTPVVTTDVGGIGEYLTDDVDGLSCPPDDSERFADLILRTLRDTPAARKRADAFFEKAANFTWDAAWAAYKRAAKLIA
ncbi:MAG TPA: glycosyltransferase family 4 protein [Bryobacteraceae bacterium]|nr:glycosyltransferase family 4 protein [Bryobacteraceae bacterium]